MAQNTIHIEFDPCEPVPAGGYKVRYRSMGSGGPYRNAPANFFTSPIEFTDNLDPVGTSYEGFIQGDCGGGKLGVSVPWVAEFTGSVPAPSSEAPSSGSVAPSSEPPPMLSNPFRYSTTEGGVCSATPTTLYWIGPGAALVPGNIMYTDPGATMPLLGQSFISDSLGTEIYNMNSGTGAIGSTTGNSC